jgi:hypothetical protein
LDYTILKSGLEILDSARAYGFAQLLQVLAGGRFTPTILNRGGVFSVSLVQRPNEKAFEDSDLWKALFAENNWQRVFLTYKKAWSSQREKVRRSLEARVGEILNEAETNGLQVEFDAKFSLPGPLDPVGFKGLKGLTGGNYSESQTEVDEANWALACLGAVVAQRYKIQKAVGNKWEYYVTLPVPEEVQFKNFRDIRSITYDKALGYTGVRNAAAHFSLMLADAVREKAQGNPHFPVRFSSVLYFCLFQAGQQYKPSIGGIVSVDRLIDTALTRPKAAEELFKTWDYLFRRGCVKGNEELAEAITELLMAPSLETYYRHARIFNRQIVDRNKGVKKENLYTDRALAEVMNYVQ